MAKYIRYQWAVSGDTSAVPDLTQSDGSVSYQTGYGAPYSIAYGSTGYKAIERTKLNGALNDITGVLQQYQGNGFPDFITSAQNGGTPYLYPIYAVVRYDDGSGVKNYQSLVTNNTDLPTVTASWKVNPMSFDLASSIHAATSKTTPVDADELPIADSATSFTLKKLTWANLKATLMNILNFPAGTVVNVARYTTSTMSTGTGAIPADDTIPQITEGTQYMALSYTPKKTGNLLRIDVIAQYACSSAGFDTCALFNGANDAIAVGGIEKGVYGVPSTFTTFVTVASLTAIPFTVRIGTNGATVTFNGFGSTRYYGGVMSSSIIVTEIAQ